MEFSYLFYCWLTSLQATVEACIKSKGCTFTAAGGTCAKKCTTTSGGNDDNGGNNSCNNSNSGFGLKTSLTIILVFLF